MLQGKNILVVGASSGIGLEVARLLSGAGANVISASRNAPEGVAVSQHIAIDLSRPDQQLSQLPERLDGLVYCPGSITLKPFNRLSSEDFLRDYQINVMGAVQVIQQALHALKKSDSASIVLYSTVAASVGMNFHASIAAAKGAIEGLARSLAAEFAVNRIRVNVIAPSLTNTPLAKQLLSSPEKQEASAKRHPLGRVGEAKDVASASVFLLSDGASWITGQIIGIDGGMSALRPL
jgi:NAD(P)-dependent dehydrogenase (short-subunit alcohol dehydrogenase family)